MLLPDILSNKKHIFGILAGWACQPEKHISHELFSYNPEMYVQQKQKTAAINMKTAIRSLVRYKQ